MKKTKERGIEDIVKKFKCMATCASGLEALVGKELRALGIECQLENGHALFTGTMADIAKASVNLRTADRIKLIIAKFEAKSFETLFNYTAALPWEKLLPLDANIHVTGKSIKSTLFSVPDCQAITKKAIVKRLSEYYHRYGRLPESGAKFPVEVALLKDQVTLTLDTTGASFFKRGYRSEKGGAPLKETLASALVMLTNWRPERAFVDPTCGSGTICIEAAMIGLNMAPGIHRHFLCEDWPWVDATLFDQARAEAKAAIRWDQNLQIMGSDIDHRMIEIAKENAERAGVGDYIKFKQMRLQDFHTDAQYGVMVSNPPYGERLSDKEAVERLYQEMGDVFRPLTTWSKYILTSDLEFEQYYGQKATKKRKLYNGALRTDYFQYWGTRPPRPKKEEN